MEIDEEPVFYHEIAEAINGYCRIIKYTNHSISQYANDDGTQFGKSAVNFDRENLEVDSITEG